MACAISKSYAATASSRKEGVSDSVRDECVQPCKGSFVSENLETNIEVKDSKMFPPLRKREFVRGIESRTSTPRKRNEVRPSSGQSRSISDNSHNNYNKSIAFKANNGSKENVEVILVNIKDRSTISFGSLLSELKSEINLKKDIGIDALQVRNTPNEGGIFVIKDKDALQKADLLADRITKIVDSKYDGNIKITRPNRTIDLIISGKDDYISCNDIATAIVLASECKLEDVNIGRLINKSYSRWSVRVTCPRLIGDKLCTIGKIQVG